MKKKLAFGFCICILAACTTLTPTESIATKTTIAQPSETVALVQPTNGSVLTPTPSLADEVVHELFQGRWELVYPNDGKEKFSPYHVASDSRSYLWARFQVRNDVELFDGMRWNIIPKDEIGLSLEAKTKTIGPIVLPDDTVWLIQSMENSNICEVFQYDGKSWRKIQFSVPKVIDRLIGVDSTENIWVTTNECSLGLECLYRYNVKYQMGYWYSPPMPLSSDHSIALTSNGDLWVSGKWSNGIARLRGNEWMVYSGKDLWTDKPTFRVGELGVQETIQVAAGYGDSVLAYLHSSSKIVRIDTNGDVSNIPLPIDTDAGISFLIIMEDKDNGLWLGIDPFQMTTGYPSLALVHYDKNKWTIFDKLPFRGFIFQFAESQRGEIWLITASGMYKYEASN